MAVPAHIKRLISECHGLPLPGVLTEVQGCEGAKFHSPQPLLVREYGLDGALVFPTDGPHTEEYDTVWLCGTCAANLTVLLCLLKAHDGDLPWEARREFGNLVRALGMRAWQHYLTQQEQTA